MRGANVFDVLYVRQPVFQQVHTAAIGIPVINLQDPVVFMLPFIQRKVPGKYPEQAVIG
jgi:hypothetical protein